MLAGYDVAAILSSHYVRCLETVVPLACDHRRAIEVHPALAEGASIRALSALVAEVAGGTAVLCTHGDVIWHLLVDVAGEPAAGEDGPPMSKGSTWVMEADEARLRAVQYLPPPARSD